MTCLKECKLLCRVALCTVCELLTHLSPHATCPRLVSIPSSLPVLTPPLRASSRTPKRRTRIRLRRRSGLDRTRMVAMLSTALALSFMPVPPRRPVSACKYYHSARLCMLMAPDLRFALSDVFDGQLLGEPAPHGHRPAPRGFRPARVCTRKPSLFMRAADALIEEADALHSAKKIDAVFDLLAGADVTDDELAWRVARAYHDKAEEITADDPVRERLLREGLAVAEAAKERSAGASTASHGYALKWYAILLGRLGDYLPTKEKVANSYKIKEALEASAALLPEDSSVQTGLGQWCYKVAGISFIERNAAKLLFGQPPASSYAEALSYLETSYALKANKKAALFAGLCQAKLKDKAAAREWLQRCLELDSVGEADRELDRQAQAALK